MDTVRKHNVSVDPSIMVSVVTALVLEGWQWRLDPELNMIDHVGDMVGKIKHVEDMIGDFSQFMYLCFDPFVDTCGREYLEREITFQTFDEITAEK